MIRASPKVAKPWSPTGFDEFPAHYPQTEWAAPDAALERTPGFLDAWNREAFSAAGHRCLRTPVSTRRTVADQATRLARDIRAWLGRDERFVWCTHSKGGIDALWALESDAALRESCIALASVQLPVGHSWVVANVESQQGGWPARLQKSAFRLPPVAAGIETISPRSRTRRWLETLDPPVPMVHVVSWSVTPTSWVDSWHGKLNALRPGHAHDGQFFLADQRLGAVPVVCLPRLDHAQPVLGGLGLDVGRFWKSLAAVAAREGSPGA